MKNSKLFCLLHTFDSRDWQQFDLYLRSSFFNQTPELIQFAGGIAELSSKEALNRSKIGRKELCRLIFPEKPYVEADFNRMCSSLMKQASAYLAYQAWQSDGIMAHYYKLQAFLDRKLSKHFSFAYKKAERTLEEASHRNIHYLQQRFLLSELALWESDSNKTRNFGPELQKSADDFDQYLLGQKLQHLCSIASSNSLQAHTYQTTFADEVGLMVAQLRHVPIIGIYESLYLMLTEEPADQHFQQLKQLATIHEDRLAQRELNIIYFSLINFCIGRIRHGEKNYAILLLDLYEIALQKGFLMDKGVISPWTFKNMVKLGLGLNRYQWVESFIRQYAPKLEVWERAEALHFNLADLYYHQEEFEKAQLHLREVEFSDIRYYVHGRILLAKIFYTTQAWDALDSLLSSFKIYLMRSKKMSREEKRPYLNFIRILDKLLRSLPEKQQKIRSMIEQTSMLSDRSWLLGVCGGQQEK